MQKNIYQIVCIFLLGLCPLAHAGDELELTSKEGRTLKVVLLRATDQQVTFRTTGVHRKEHTVGLDALSAGSVERVKAWVDAGGGLSTDLEITYRSGKATRLSSRENYDDRSMTLQPSVSLKNADRYAATSGLKLTLCVFGKSAKDSRAYYVFIKESKKLDTLQPDEQRELSFDAIKVEYDDRGYAKYGSRYHGYAVLVQNAHGELVAFKAIPSTYEKFGLELLKLKPKQYFDRDLQPYEIH